MVHTLYLMLKRVSQSFKTQIDQDLIFSSCFLTISDMNKPIPPKRRRFRPELNLLEEGPCGC